MKAYHYSHSPLLTELDPNRFGENKSITPEAKHGTKGLVPKNFIYTEDRPEAVVAQGRHRYEVDVPDHFKFYDLGEDPEGIVKQVHQKTGLVGAGLYDQVEHSLRAAGYHGYQNKSHGTLSHVAASFYPLKAILSPIKPDIEKAELEKGVNQRLFPAPNPEAAKMRQAGIDADMVDENPALIKDPNKRATALWQGPAGEKQSIRDHDEPHLRSVLPKLEGNDRVRALRKLAAKTKWRRNPSTGEAEFLLHRGAGNTETLESSKNDYSSWTPNYDIARDFAQGYKEEYKDPNNIHSAWIPETDIHHIPVQGSAYLYNIQGNLYPRYSDEFEVVVRPGHKAIPEKFEPFLDRDAQKMPQDIDSLITEGKSHPENLRILRRYRTPKVG